MVPVDKAMYQDAFFVVEFRINLAPCWHTNNGSFFFILPKIMVPVECTFDNVNVWGN